MSEALGTIGQGLKTYGTPFIEGVAQSFAGYDPNASKLQQLKMEQLEMQKQQMKQQQEAQDAIHASRSAAEMNMRAYSKLKDKNKEQAEKALNSALQNYSTGASYGDRYSQKKLEAIRKSMIPDPPKNIGELEARRLFESGATLQDIQRYQAEKKAADSPLHKALVMMDKSKRENNMPMYQAAQNFIVKQSTPNWDQTVVNSLNNREIDFNDAMYLMGKKKPMTLSQVEGQMAQQHGLDYVYGTKAKYKKSRGGSGGGRSGGGVGGSKAAWAQLAAEYLANGKAKTKAEAIKMAKRDLGSRGGSSGGYFKGTSMEAQTANMLIEREGLTPTEALKKSKQLRTKQKTEDDLVREISIKRIADPLSGVDISDPEAVAEDNRKIRAAVRLVNTPNAPKPEEIKVESQEDEGLLSIYTRAFEAVAEKVKSKFGGKATTLPAKPKELRYKELKAQGKSDDEIMTIMEKEGY